MTSCMLYQETNTNLLQQAGVERTYGRARLCWLNVVEITRVCGEQSTVSGNGRIIDGIATTKSPEHQS